MNAVTRGGPVVVAVLGLMAAACADDSSEPISAPSSTELSATTTEGVANTATARTTTAPTTTTTSGSTSTTTEPQEFPYWTVECSERTGGGGGPYVVDPALLEFTTLGAEPVLDIMIPGVVTSAGPYESIASTDVIPGGVLIAVTPPNGWPTPKSIESSSLTAVDDDGVIRWRRCFDDTGTVLVAPAGLAADTAWRFSYDTPAMAAGVDLATGADVAFSADVAGLALRGQGERFAVLGVAGLDAGIDDGSRLLVVDLVDGSTEEVAYPPEAFGADWYQFFTVYDVDPLDDEYVLVLGSLSAGDVRSVRVDGSWTTGRDVWRSVLPPAITETSGAPFELRMLDGAGDVVWAAPDFHGISRDGFRWAIADHVVVAVRCAEWDADGACTWVDDEPPVEELVGYDLLTGVELWSTPGARSLTAVTGDTALATARAGEFGLTADGYVMLDLLTGDAVPGGAWPAGAFAEGCCAMWETVHVKRDAGVVVATSTDHVRVWYPPELTTPTVTVDLMG